jgi:H/ACA ribonucleoprotein complex subunit 2
MAAEKPDKKEKKDKKRSDESGVSKSKKEKKDKKDKKEKLAAALEEKIQQDAPVAAAAAANMDEDSDAEEDKAAELPLERTVVPFALPVADEKGMKKVYKTIRKGMQLQKTMCFGQIANISQLPRTTP